MTRKFLLFLALSVCSISLAPAQDSYALWLDLGLGIVGHRFEDGSVGLCGSAGISGRYSAFTLSYRRIYNSDLSLFKQAHEINTQSIVFGYVIPLSGDSAFVNFSLNLGAGIGSAEEKIPYIVSNGGSVWAVYDTRSRSSICAPLQVIFESRLKYVFGVSMTFYSIYGRFSPLYGGYLSLMVGYW